jgi:sec-independent protein translocase protein TatA
MFRNPTTDLIVVLVIVLLIFGPKRLPGLGKQLGQGLREFKDSITGDSTDEEGERPALTQSNSTPGANAAEAGAGAAEPTQTRPAAGAAEGQSAERRV